MKLNFSYDMAVERAYVIALVNNETSMAMAKRCLKSCEDAGMVATVWEAFDGTQGKIVAPRIASWHSWIKQVDKQLSVTEVACALSHISLWAQCMELDRPIVILEHDAIMVKPYLKHEVFNSICYLGNNEQVNQGWQVLPTPPHASNGNNYHFLCRAHAYAIDPAVAKNLMAHVIKYGIHESLDIMLRADIFPIHQMGVYAYDSHGETTITHRKTAADGGQR